MDIFLTNTLSGTKELFTPLKKGSVSMYHCGPTVYDTVHIGNLRSFVMNDLIRRTFEYNGYKVKQVMNITDVDDKTIRRSMAEDTPLASLTEKYEKLFLDDSEALNILHPHSLLRATDHIDEMISMIEVLIKKGIAYISKDGVYFSIGLMPHYGALAHLSINTQEFSASAAQDVSRIAQDEYEKENPRDFALWKFYTLEDGTVAWDAPFGRGRPGWHIECSAMATHALGATIDIHTGGTDLIFPHHTNEIAQSESATGKKFVHYWIHGGFMNVHDVKMAKSKGNFLKLADLVTSHISPLAFRYWLMNAHYHTQVNFTLEAVQASQTAFVRLIETLASWKEALRNEGVDVTTQKNVGEISQNYKERFLAAINDDLNFPAAIAAVWDLVKDTSLTLGDRLVTVLDFDRALGLNLDTLSTLPPYTPSPIPEEIIALAEAREVARTKKDWVQADALRQEINDRGYTVLDKPKGYELLEA